MWISIIIIALVYQLVYGGPFSCRNTGLYPNLNDVTCQSYIFCSELSNGIFIQKLYKCPTGTSFDPQLRTCSRDCTQCSSHLEQSTRKNFRASNVFNCIAQGRFPEVNDKNCSSYYYCYYLTNGKYLKKLFMCPRGKKFDPKLQTCTASYVCESNTTPEPTNEYTSQDKSSTANDNFGCSTQGKFPVTEDFTCSSYYYCLYLPTEKYIRKIYKCESGKKFDPKLQTCSRNYKCELSSTTGTYNISSTTLASITSDTDNTNLSPDLSTPSLQSEIPMKSTTTGLTKLSDSFNIYSNNMSSNFKCVSKGKFPVQRDTTCQTFYYCFHLPNGELGHQIDSCATGKMFNPELQICSESYQCTVSMTTTTKTPDIHFNCSSPGNFHFTEDATCRTYYYCFLLPNGKFGYQLYECAAGERFDPELQRCSKSYQCSVSTTTALTPHIHFNCTSPGNFAVKEDATCRTYYYCFILPNGKFGYQLYGCAAGERFNPELQRCSESYQCSVSTTTAMTPNINFNCTSPGNFPVEEDATCRTYYYCFILPNGKFGYQLYGCAAGGRFDPELQRCSESYQCSVSTTTAMTPDIHFNCTSPGNFPVKEDATCRTYYYCFLLPNGKFGYQLYGCAAGGRFDPELQRCSDSYQCPISTTTAMTPNIHFNCTSPGNFPVKEDATCRTYYYCFLLPNGKFGYQLYGCAAGERFDPELQRCSESYQCSVSTTTAMTPNIYFNCSSTGNFPVEEDATCRTYYCCFLLPNGKFGYQLYGCAAGERFDPELQRCSVSYQCSVSTTTAMTPNIHFNCTSTGNFPVEEDATCRTYYYCFLLPNGKSGYQLYGCAAGERFDPELQRCSVSYQCSVSTTTAMTPNIHFNCTSTGNFPVEEDATCRTYYYCFLLPNGKFGYQLYGCAAGERFDPELQRCSVNYQCSVSTTTAMTPNIHFNCTSTGNFPVEEDATCRTYYYCFLLPNGKFGYQLYGCAAGERFDPELQRCSVNYQCSVSTTTAMTPNIHFNCTSTGNFPVEEDATCRTYYYCFLLPNGKFGYQLYGCAAGERFDPELQRCSVSYQCSVSTTTAMTPNIHFNCTSTGNFPVEEDATCRTYYYCFLLPNGKSGYQLYGCAAGERFDPELQRCSVSYQCSVSTTTAMTPNIHFNCTSTGNFPVEEDATCRTYYYCFLLPNGKFGYQLYGCAAGERFDPELQRCSVNYQCSVSTTTAMTPNIHFNCTSTGNFPVEEDATCRTYYYCFLLPNGKFGYQLYGCAAGERFDPELQRCSVNYQCSVSTTTAMTPNIHFNCTSTGNFPVEEDATCRTYYYCFLLPNGKFGYQLYGCAAGERFDPELQRCSLSYQCSVSTTTAMTPNIHFNCTSTGNFPVEEDATCRTYYYCFLLPNGKFGYQLYGCAAGERFDPELQRCSVNYQCSVSTTTAMTPNIHFNCTSTGNFPVEEDATCRTYYYCFLLPNGKFGYQLYGCAAGERFDPELQRCSLSYQCSVSTTTAMTPNIHFNCTSTGNFPVEEDATCRTYYYCFLLPNGKFGYQLYGCAAGERFDPELQRCSVSYQCSVSTTTAMTPNIHFNCTSTGNFPVEEDATCRTYYYCFLLPNGKFGYQLYGCAAGERFDPELKRCTESYSCSIQLKFTSIPSNVIRFTEMSIFSSDTDISVKVHYEKENGISSLSNLNYNCNGNSSVLQNLSCTATGRFTNYNDETCKLFYTCISLESDVFITRDFVCPDDERFDPNMLSCSTHYICPCWNLENSSKAADKNGVCKTPGRMPDPLDTQCKYYYFCVSKEDSTFIGIRYACKSSEFFDPVSQTCTKSYVCQNDNGYTSKDPTGSITGISMVDHDNATLIDFSTSEIGFSTNSDFVNESTTSSEENFSTLISISTQTSITSTDISSSYSTSNAHFICTSSGRFPVIQDETCKLYTLCATLDDFTFTSFQYTCPASELFNPVTEKCSKTFSCPYGSSTSVDAWETKVPTRFTCNTTGRFADDSDTTCNSYFMCITLDGGTFVSRKYSCEKGYKFNPASGYCDETYKCP